MGKINEIMSNIMSTRKMMFLFALTIGLSLIVCSVYAADLPGAKDHPLLKRFCGSEIVGYEFKNFEAYEIQTSTYVKCDWDTKRREFVKPPIQVEGALTRIWYEAAGNASSTEVLRNYQNELKANKFEILYDSTRDPKATKWNSFLTPFAGMDPKTDRNQRGYVFFSANKEGIRVTSARLKQAEGDVYVYLICVEWGKDNATFHAKRGVYAAVDIIEVKPMTQNMVTVSADEMSKALTTEGRVALYGIYFDSNKTEIKPESKPALDEIAKLLKQSPKLKLHVVGHTDNVGGLDFNMNLSKRRAEAVVAALAKQYGIAANRLTANGVAYLAPVAVNTTEEGRAKNRRVELIPW